MVRSSILQPKARSRYLSKRKSSRRKNVVKGGKEFLLISLPATKWGREESTVQGTKEGVGMEKAMKPKENTAGKDPFARRKEKTPPLKERHSYKKRG